MTDAVPGDMTKQSKVRLAVVALLLAVGVGAPVASVVGNAPRPATAALSTETLESPKYREVEFSEGVTTEIPEVTVTAAPPARRAGPATPSVRSCRRVALEQQGIEYDSSVKMCEG